MTVMPCHGLLVDKVLRQLGRRERGGWKRTSQVPSAATLSRAFAAFAASCLPERAHAAPVEARPGGKDLRVRGPIKAMCHLMLGIPALTMDQLSRLVT